MIKNFNLSESNVDNFISKLKSLDLQNVRYVANVIERKSSRSLEQNNLYWSFVTEFAAYTGYDKDMMHDILRYKFLYEVAEIEGKEHRRLLSTTKQGTKAMAEYFDNCLRYAAENGFYYEA